MHISFRPNVAVVAALFAFIPCTFGQEPVALVERIAPGVGYRINTRVELKGELSVPIGPDKPPELMKMYGASTIDYDERVLSVDGKLADHKAVRQYRAIDFRRRLGDKSQEITLRPSVHRLVVMKKGRAKVPFSPDGPLTWGEIDLLRTDVFFPGILGVLPGQAVKPGDSWKVSDSATAELTDMEKIEQGELVCKFDQEVTFRGRKYADISLSGELKGINEDGPNRQKLTGRIYFDLKSNHISYLYINGEHSLLDKDGKVSGKISGNFTMSRELNPRNPDLTDAALSKVALEPNADNTLLLYEEPEIGLRFLHPRRWRIGRTQKGQITLDESNGSGLLITLEYPDRVPSVAAYLKETRDYLAGQKAKIIEQPNPVRLSAAPNELDQFSYNAEIGGQRLVMDYLIVRQANAGATFAARILEKDREALVKEVEKMARSMTLSRKFEKRP